MLSTAHKANILRKAGYDVPAYPSTADELSIQIYSTAPALRGNSIYQTTQSWCKAVDALYATYAAARAAQSLRDAEAAQQMAMMQCRPARAYASAGEAASL